MDPQNLIVLAAGILWFGAALARPIGDYGVETDFYGDVRYAKEWMRGEPSVMNGFRGPLYYLVLGTLALLGDYFLVGKLLSVVSAALAVRLAGGVLRRLWGPVAGIAGVLFLVGNPHMVEYGIRACTDPFYLLLAGGFLYLVLVPEIPTARAWLAAGALAASAWLTRYNGLALVPAAVVTAALIVRPLPRAGRLVALFAAAWIVVGGPWILFLGAKTGDPLWSNAYQNIAIQAYAPDAATAQNTQFMASVGFSSLDEVVRVDPRQVLSSLAQNTVRHLRDDMKILVGWFWAVPALVGFVLGGKRWLRPRALAFAFTGLLTYASSATVFYNPRFMMPLLIFWAAGIGILAAWILERVPAWIPGASRKTGKRLARGLQACVFGGLVVIAAVTNTRVIRAGSEPEDGRASPVEILDLVKEVRRAGVPVGTGTPIAARKPHIGHYLGAPVIPVPTGTVEDIRAAGAHYFLVSGKEALQYPALMPLMYVDDPAKIPTGLRLVARALRRYPSGVARAASLYAVENPKPYVEPAVHRGPSGDRPVIEGLSRIDSLRLRLVRWMINWEGDEPMERYFGVMSEEARDHPAVLETRGDVYLVRGETAEAETAYRRALERGGDATRLWSRLALLAYLHGDLKGVVSLLSDHLGEPSVSRWSQLGMDAFATLDFMGAAGPLAGCVALDSTSVLGLKGLSLCLTTLKMNEPAKDASRRYLALRPDDQEIRNQLQKLEESPPQ